MMKPHIDMLVKSSPYEIRGLLIHFGRNVFDYSRCKTVSEKKTNSESFNYFLSFYRLEDENFRRQLKKRSYGLN